MLQEMIATATDIVPLRPERLLTAKAAYTTRRIYKTAVKTLIQGDLKPLPGDLLLARVEKIGHHKRIELEHGRRAPLFIGDEIVVSYGHRYAPDQFESEVPKDLSQCHLVAAGGIASRCLSRHLHTCEPTLIQPLGLLADGEGQVINMRDWALPHVETKAAQPLIIAVAGTSMNAGKTTTAAHLIKGLARSGIPVGAAKITGTGAGGDRWLMADAGAIEVVDFTDAGYASTYHVPLPRLEQIQSLLVGHLRSLGAEIIVLEIADGLFQQETNMLLASSCFRDNVDAMIFAAGDAMGASGGVAWLRQHDLPIVALSGCLSSSPLASREAAQASGLPVVGPEELGTPGFAAQLFAQSVVETEQPAMTG